MENPHKTIPQENPDIQALIRELQYTFLKVQRDTWQEGWDARVEYEKRLKHETAEGGP